MRDLSITLFKHVTALKREEEKLKSSLFMSYQRNASDEKSCAFINLFCIILLTERDDEKYELRENEFIICNMVRISDIDIVVFEFELGSI